MQATSLTRLHPLHPHALPLFVSVTLAVDKPILFGNSSSSSSLSSWRWPRHHPRSPSTTNPPHKRPAAPTVPAAVSAIATATAGNARATSFLVDVRVMRSGRRGRRGFVVGVGVGVSFAAAAAAALGGMDGSGRGLMPCCGWVGERDWRG
ncbi:uncharacterized protein BKCO1_37000165 [Diplodia corticola]|uniref:Uncharacterized protein n=1 Tax=Diplodia corticola TaxID=236234 RepID=A0A1J9QXD9_9PEZI|nr:uncharacterized protein BKCO1_37000165 [Diplodia corticola]OJD32650.1 hypothetical protein BKCO1_37000165 [Diplodia corticola]